MGNSDPIGAGAARRRIVAAQRGRLDAMIALACPDLSRARIQRLISDGHARVNGIVARKSHRVEPDDVIEFAIVRTPHLVVAEPIDLPVLYEDDDLLAIDKPAGLAVHGAPGDVSPSVASWMLARLGQAADEFPVEHPGIVHRLDKNTSGVLLLANHPAAQTALSSAFEARTATKTYLAVTDGVPDRPRAIIDAPIARDPAGRTRMAISRSGRGSRTEYEVLAEDRGRALLLVHPETGRTHQIRVHLAGIGCPVTFDAIYGNPGPGRQLLHAWRIAIPHPAGGSVQVTSPLAADFAAFVRASSLEPVASEYMKSVVPARARASS